MKAQIVIETLKQWTKKPDSFAYWGDKDMFNTWGYVPIGVTTRDDRDTLNESNQQTIIYELEKINPKHVEIQDSNHWACGWVKQIAIKVFHNGKPTKVALKALELKQKWDEYPVLDDSDYSERECDAEVEDFNCYENDFNKEVLKYFGFDSKPKGISKQALSDLSREIHREDCGYRGREDGFVTPESIERFLKGFDKDYFGHYSAKTIKKLRGLKS